MRKKYIKRGKCPNCGWLIKTKDDIAWLCERCKSSGMIKDLYKTENSEEKPELSEEWKKLTGEK